MKKLIIVICTGATIAASIAISVFISHFGLGFTSSLSNWGAVGDFFGGVLNPTFALLSLILIAYTLMQNKKALEQSEKAIEQGTKAIEQNEAALRVSNEELTLTRNELANSSEALKEQAKLLAIQSFETTFFNMLELHSKTLDKVRFNANSCFSKISSQHEISSIKSQGECHGAEAFSSIVRFINEISDEGNIIDYFELFYTYEGKDINIYFRNLYQAFKMIDDAFSNPKTEIKYSNLLRAQLSDEELVLILLYCLNPRLNEEAFKKLIIKYALFEPLDIVFIKSSSGFKIGSIGITLSTNEIHSYMEFNEQNKLINSAFGSNSKVHSYCFEQGFLK